MRLAERAQVDMVLCLWPPDLGLVGFLLAVLEEEDILIACCVALAQHELECAKELDGLASVSLASSPMPWRAPVPPLSYTTQQTSKGCNKGCYKDLLL